MNFLRWAILFTAVAWCGGNTQAGEHIIVSGGPALQYFERAKEHPHDRYWGNFIDAGIARIRQVKPQFGPEDFVTWAVFRPSYISRSREENLDLVKEIENRANTLQVNLLWFDDRDQFLAFLNQSREGDKKIARLEYFGHSNRRTFMFDYSNTLDGSSTEPGTLHMSRLKAISRDNFTNDAYCKSWGCHSGEEYSAAWRKATGQVMVGAIGKTDYSQGGLPFLSTTGGRWAP